MKHWSNNIEKENHGINLKSSDEIELFEHFFNDKKMFSHQLKILLRNNKIGRLGLTLKKIRSKIEIIEKQRCWLSVLNNRLYKNLQNELTLNKDKLDLNNTIELDEILANYINNGIKYSKTINKISHKALNTIKRKSLIEMKTIKNSFHDNIDEKINIDNYLSSDSDVEFVDEVTI